MSRRILLLSTTALLILIAIIMNPSSSPPVSDQPIFADHPFALISTPVHLTEKDDMYTVGASHMALLHNVILRGWNSIYLQAPHIKPEDFPDFIGYASAWCRFVKAHHDDEEANLFPKLAEVAGVPTLMDESNQEHRLFEEGLDKMTSYIAACPVEVPNDEFTLSLVEIMDSFSAPFYAHFGPEGEVAHLASFATLYPDQPELRTVFATWGKQSLMKTGVTDGVAFMFYNLDRSWEGGRWETWPRIPAPIKWGLINIGGLWNAGWWRFGSCTKEGVLRELEALKK